MKTLVNTMVIVAFFTAFGFCQSQEQKEQESASTERDRVKESGEVLKQIVEMDKGVPKGLLKDSKCVIVLPSVKKVAVVIGGTYGRGVMSCRTGADYKGPWSAPIMMASSGGNIGLQIGGEATDFVIIVLNDEGAKRLITNKVKLGADASVAAGPVGRTAEASTNASMRAEMLSYSRSRGVFGGVSLSGATLRPDGSANDKLYGKEIKPQQIVAGQVAMPPEAEPLITALEESQQSAKK